MSPRPKAVTASRPTMQRGSLLNFILRGEMFRLGHRTTRLTNGDTHEQELALRSHQKYVVAPLSSLHGRVVHIYADVSCAKNRHLEAEDLLRAMGCQEGGFRINSEVAATQTESMMRTLAWLESHDLWHDDAIFCRPDLKFHGTPPWPESWEPREVLFPWHVDGDILETTNQPANDVFFLVGRGALASGGFTRAVSRMVNSSNYWVRKSLHGLPDFAGEYEAKPLYHPSLARDANPMFEWNPLYTVIGRRCSTYISKYWCTHMARPPFNEDLRNRSAWITKGRIEGGIDGYSSAHINHGRKILLNRATFESEFRAYCDHHPRSTVAEMVNSKTHAVATSVLPSAGTKGHLRELAACVLWKHIVGRNVTEDEARRLFFDFPGTGAAAGTLECPR